MAIAVDSATALDSSVSLASNDLAQHQTSYNLRSILLSTKVAETSELDEVMRLSASMSTESLLLAFPTISNEDLKLTLVLSDPLSLGSPHAFPSLILPSIKFTAKTRASSGASRLKSLLFESEHEEAFLDVEPSQAAMKEAVRTVAMARTLLQQDGYDCFFSINTPTDSSITRLRIYRKALPVPVVDISDFSSLEKSMVTSLTSVLQEILDQRPEVDLSVTGPKEMALALKSLAIVTTRSSSNGSLVSGGCCSFIRPLSPNSSWPLILTARRLPLIASTLGRCSVMGPARGKVTPGTTSEQLRKALSAELANAGYWSCVLHSPALVQAAVEAALALERPLAQRSSRIAIVPEFVPSSPKKPPSASSSGKPSPSANSSGKPSPSASSLGKPSSYLVLHFIECDEELKVVEMLASFLKRSNTRLAKQPSLKNRQAKWETALYGPNQLLSIHKASTLYNSVMARKSGAEDGKPSESSTREEMVLRPFIGQDRILMIESSLVKLPILSPSVVLSAASEAQPEGQGAVVAKEKRPEIEHLVSKESDAKMLARAVSFEAINRRPKGGQAGCAIVLASLKMALGKGETLLTGATAMAMAQNRISSELTASSSKGEKTEAGDSNKSQEVSTIQDSVLVLPTTTKVEEDGRTFPVAKWTCFSLEPSP